MPSKPRSADNKRPRKYDSEIYFLDCPEIESVHKAYTPEALEDAIESILSQKEEEKNKTLRNAPKAPRKQIEWQKRTGRPLKAHITRKATPLRKEKTVRFNEQVQVKEIQPNIFEFLIEDPLDIGTYGFVPPHILRPIFGLGIQQGLLWTDILLNNSLSIPQAIDRYSAALSLI
ncbi:hypothetical protein BDZ91DRAFT_729142 [Kalaharituber pfeilii]|nr:hypothetical protein BDZ91DRAFT_729142 [Kalaharituber pfeilii]